MSGFKTPRAGRVAAADRRAVARAKLALNVQLRFASTEDLVRCQTFNVGRGGAFVMLESPRPAGTQVRLQIDVPGRRMVVGAVVVWSSDGRTGPPGLGIRFTEMTADDAEFLDALLRAYT